MSKLAQQIIAENKAKHARGEDARVLDLGKCGLTELPDLSGMDWLETLIVSNEWVDGEQRKWVTSQNSGPRNDISLSLAYPLPSSLRNMIFGGSTSNTWSIGNVVFLEKLINLTKLDISFNHLSDYSFLEKLTNLTALSIHSNPISDYSFLEKLTNLTSLDIHSNQISDFRFLKNLNNLNSLDIRNCKIRDARFLEKLTNLTSLYISYNPIKDYNFLKKLTNLILLDIHNNNIVDYNFIENLNNLLMLDISYNNISDARMLKKLSNLTSLYIHNNQISDASFLENLNSITTLNMSSNQISDLEPFLPLLKKGIPLILKQSFSKGINLYNNPISNPPLEIVTQGNAAILRYFEELQTEDIRPLNEAKLIVIGQPRAGKTSLRYKLCDTEREMPLQEDSTRGIDIELQSFTYTDEVGAAQTFQYHIWDFGGQQIYHATHRFFLTKRTVYVAVVDTDVNDKQNDLDYWLHMVELMGDGSPVVLVQNQKNDRSIEISDALRNRFRNILVVKDYELNLARLRKQENPNFNPTRLIDFHHFKKDIQRIFEHQAPILMTRQKIDTRHALERLSKEKPVLEISEYRAVCAKNGLEDPLAQTDLLRTLHNLGICLWYEGYDFLERIVILQNRWATDAVFKVLDNEMVKKDKGHFRRQHLNQIWDNNEYKGRVSELVELMKQFKLCYQIGQSDEYIVPQLLDKNPPADFSRASIQQEGVRMVIYYEFMPRGIMTQLIVAMHRQISGGQRHAWEKGFAVLSQQGPSVTGMAEESYDSRKIELWAQGPRAGLLLQQMLDELEKIHFSFNRLRYTKHIPCNCKRCSAQGALRIKEFDYDEILLEMYENRQQSIRCSYGNQIVQFDQLLRGLGFTAQKTERDFRRGEFGNNLNFHIHVEDKKTHEILEDIKRSTDSLEKSNYIIQNNQQNHTLLLKSVLEFAKKEQTLLKEIFTKMDAFPESNNTDIERINGFLTEQFGKLLERLPDEHKIVAAWKEATEAPPHDTDLKWTLKVKIPLIFADFEKDLAWDGKKMLKSIRDEFVSFGKGDRSFRELFWED